MTENSTPAADDAPESTSPDAAELQADIERTREDLARTVDQLTARLDVRTRVRERADDVRANVGHQARTLRERATDSEGNPTPATVGIGSGVGAAAVAVLLAVLWHRNATSKGRR